MMEIAPLNGIGAKLILPEIVQRSRKIAKMVKTSHRTSNRVDKVYNSKKNCLATMQNQCQQIRALVATKKQKQKSLLFNRSDEYTRCVDIVNKTKQLQRRNHDLIKEEETMLDDFGKTLHEMDEKFLQSVANYTEDNLRQTIQDLKKEMMTLQAKIEKNKRAPFAGFICDIGSIQALQKIVQSPESLAEMFEKKSKELEILTAELESTE